jgi:hypothetical protein
LRKSGISVDFGRNLRIDSGFGDLSDDRLVGKYILERALNIAGVPFSGVRMERKPNLSAAVSSITFHSSAEFSLIERLIGGYEALTILSDGSGSKNYHQISREEGFWREVDSGKTAGAFRKESHSLANCPVLDQGGSRGREEFHDEHRAEDRGSITLTRDS